MGKQVAPQFVFMETSASLPALLANERTVPAVEPFSKVLLPIDTLCVDVVG